MEPNSPKKIQFAVPLFQSQIDPEAAEQIRKRRPTPASLVIMNEHMPPEKDEKRTNISQAESQSASPKQRKQSVFTPPALKGTAGSCPQKEYALGSEQLHLGLASYMALNRIWLDGACSEARSVVIHQHF
uniref:Protein phosphatase 1 regulatory inhibitor subunit 1C n=1 Tax=Catharus ustulatus TaxID=91951 RepID=A0A8C3U7L1_CATUS